MSSLLLRRGGVRVSGGLCPRAHPRHAHVRASSALAGMARRRLRRVFDRTADIGIKLVETAAPATQLPVKRAFGDARVGVWSERHLVSALRGWHHPLVRLVLWTGLANGNLSLPACGATRPHLFGHLELDVAHRLRRKRCHCLVPLAVSKKLLSSRRLTGPCVPGPTGEMTKQHEKAKRAHHQEPFSTVILLRNKKIADCCASPTRRLYRQPADRTRHEREASMRANGWLRAQKHIIVPTLSRTTCFRIPLML